jgi:hypothetical protein
MATVAKTGSHAMMIQKREMDSRLKPLVLTDPLNGTPHRSHPSRMGYSGLSL